MSQIEVEKISYNGDPSDRLSRLFAEMAAPFRWQTGPLPTKHIFLCISMCLRCIYVEYCILCFAYI